MLVIALVFVAYQGLNNATLFFRNADEAVAQRAELGDKRFRLQGTVVEGTVQPDGTTVRFDVTYNGVEVPVQHLGDPPELFQPDIPVVLEGHWSQTDDVVRERPHPGQALERTTRPRTPTASKDYMGQDGSGDSGQE